jgi:hypothetical protein
MTRKSATEALQAPWIGLLGTLAFFQFTFPLNRWLEGGAE